MASNRMAKPEAITVRYATPQDVPTILQLIQELARYEKQESAVLATEATLHKTLDFPPFPSASSPPQRGFARALLLLFDGAPVGMALFFFNYSTWHAAPGIYLEDLYIKEEARGHGGGKLLIAELAAICKGVDGRRLDWSVLDWNQPSIDFYESAAIGAKILNEWKMVRVEGKALDELAAKARGVPM